MTILHLSYSYGLCEGGGAAIAASRLHNALLDAGINSHYVCIKQFDEGLNVHILPKSPFLRKIHALLSRGMRGIWKFSRLKQSVPLNILPWPGLDKLVSKLKPDVIHTHWINISGPSFCSLRHLNAAIVVNLHDLWMLNAIESQPGDDQRFINGFTWRNSHYLERWFFRRKKRFCEVAHVSFVGPSKWTVDMCQASIIGKNHPVACISNVISNVFTFDQHLCQQNKKCVFLFGCDGGTKNFFKGFPEIEKALSKIASHLRDKCTLWIFGESANDMDICGVSVRFLGKITEPQKLRSYYHQADVFLFPSKIETQGLTKIEAMMCGLPVIAFHRTACAEGIINGKNGWIVSPDDIDGFAHAMEEAILLQQKGKLEANRPNNAILGAKQFSRDHIISTIVQYYKNVSVKKHNKL